MSRVYLSTIIDRKIERLNALNDDVGKLKELAEQAEQQPSMREALTKEGLSIIGEIKKASPSKGLIKPDFKPLEIASVYQNSVDAISVLTEEEFFLGCDDYLKEVSKAVTIPTLCKDFTLQESQIYKAKTLGASAILLIVAILTPEQVAEYEALAHSLSMDAIVEVHTKEEMAIAVGCGVKIIGINNRDLHTFETDVKRTLELREYVPDNTTIISESGIMGIDDIITLKQAEVDGILVGESFMRTGDIAAFAKEIKRVYQG